MNREDMIRMAREAGMAGMLTDVVTTFDELERFAALVEAKVAAAERNKLAAWMMAQGYATGHGDTMEDLLAELDWQVKERVGAEREACAKVVVDLFFPEDSPYHYIPDGRGALKEAHVAIRARGQA